MTARHRRASAVLVALAVAGTWAVWRAMAPADIPRRGNDGIVVVQGSRSTTLTPAPAANTPAPVTVSGPAVNLTPQLAADAERQVAAFLAPSLSLTFKGARLADAKKLVVCGQVDEPGGTRRDRRYISFAGTGVAAVDDGSAAFATVFSRHCASR